MKRSILFLLLMTTCTLAAISQKPRKPNPYTFGIGVGYNPKLDKPVSINAKWYLKSGNALEFIGYNLDYSYRVTALFLPYLTLDRTGNLRLLVGPGVHVGVWKSGYKLNTYRSNPIIGGDGMIGLEYRLPKIPLTLQAHFQPSADIAGNNEYYYGKEGMGVVARFVF